MVGWVGGLEGGMVGGWIKTAGGVWRKYPQATERPSWCKIALRVWWGLLVFGGFA